MKAQLFCVCLAPLVCGSAGNAQEASTPARQATPEIKSLSASEIQGYVEGQGMGLGKAAELNGYPGPAHVLELD